MKKLMNIIMSAVILASTCAFTVSAETTNNNADVFAKTDDNSVYIETATVENGKVDLVTKDGKEVLGEIGSDIANNLLFNVVDVYKGEKTKFFQNIFKGETSNLLAYDVYFMNTNNEKIAVNTDAKTKIKIGKQFKSPVVYFVKDDGTVEKINSTFENETINFSKTDNGYYMIAESEYVLASKEDPQDPEDPKDPESPSTGDSSNYYIWILTAILSLSAIVVLRRKKVN